MATTNVAPHAVTSDAFGLASRGRPSAPIRAAVRAGNQCTYPISSIRTEGDAVENRDVATSRLAASMNRLHFVPANDSDRMVSVRSLSANQMACLVISRPLSNKKPHHSCAKRKRKSTLPRLQ
jgi:hypothetical protein